MTESKYLSGKERIANDAAILKIPNRNTVPSKVKDASHLKTPPKPSAKAGKQ